jgi:hypothetical protein
MLVQTIFSDVSKTHPKVTIIDPNSYLCDNNHCWATFSGLMLYRDFNHLSISGSKYIGTKLYERIKEAE